MLPADAWLTDLGRHELRGVPRPERVVQLCHPDLVNEFPPLRVSTSVVSQRLPVQLTSFVGRDAELTQLSRAAGAEPVVTLTGAGGVGKTRLAVQIAGQMALSSATGRGMWTWRRSPIPMWCRSRWPGRWACPTNPAAQRWTRCCGLLGDRQMLVVLDNCEHLLDACAELVVALLGGAPGLTVLATSREPIGVGGEAMWRVPSLSVADEAIELFADRAR